MKEKDRGAVFMRWKERFVVPDHRVEDINGASFAGQLFLAQKWAKTNCFHFYSGFYYVCVDVNPQPPTSATRASHVQPSGLETATSMKPEQQHPLSIATTPLPSLRRSSVTSPTGRSVRRTSHAYLHSPVSPSGAGATSQETTATMHGFYFHQNSEP